MRLARFLPLVLAIALFGTAFRLPIGQITPAGAPAAELSAGDAAILGLVEGVTEFLPISSTGHLIIANHVLGLNSEAPLTDAKGEPLWYRKPSEKYPGGVPLTLKLAADTYAVVIQVGAILAVALLYWPQIKQMLGAFTGDIAGLRLVRNVFLAFMPVAIAGLTLNSWIDKHLFSVHAVVVALISGAALMFCAEWWRKGQWTLSQSRMLPQEMSAKKALGIGLLQCCALWPGTSRSMVTIVGGYFAGLNPSRAAEFSFLVGLPVLAGAAVVKGYKSGGAMIEVFGLPNILLGALVASVSAAIAVKFLVSYLSRHGLGLFAYYRLILAAVLAAVYLF